MTYVNSPYVCEFCRKGFESPQALTQHKKDMHGENLIYDKNANIQELRNKFGYFKEKLVRMERLQSIIDSQESTFKRFREILQELELENEINLNDEEYYELAKDAIESKINSLLKKTESYINKLEEVINKTNSQLKDVRKEFVNLLIDHDIESTTIEDNNKIKEIVNNLKSIEDLKEELLKYKTDINNLIYKLKSKRSVLRSDQTHSPYCKYCGSTNTRPLKDAKYGALYMCERCGRNFKE